MRAQLIAVFVAVLVVVSVPTCFAQGWDGGDYLWDARDAATTPTQSWFGGTGMVVIPTAEVVQQKQLNAHFHTINVDNKDDDWAEVWGVTTSIFPGFEAGITNLDQAFTGTNNEELVFGAKYAANLDDLLKLGPESPDIAVGGRDLTDEIGETWFVVLSKRFGMDQAGDNEAAVSLGLGNSEQSGAPLDGVFLGVDLTPFDFARLQLEYDSENVNAALRYWWSDWAVTDVGVLDGQLGLGATLHTGW